MNMQHTSRRFTVVVLASALVLGTVGVVLGVNATSQPSVVRGGDQHRVTLLADTENVSARVLWRVGPTGEVYVSLSAQSEVTESFTVYVVLTCDARLTDLHITDGSPLMHKTSTTGTEDACRSDGDPFFDPEGELATQIIILAFRGENILVDGIEVAPYFRGRHVVPWTEKAGGIRVTRTPEISFSAIAGLTPRDVQNNSHSLAEESDVHVKLEAAPREAPDEYRPEEVLEGSVRTPHSPSESIGSIGWWRNNGPMPATYARWIDTSSASAAQMSLIMSGALLGIAASLLVELVFDRARAGKVLATRRRTSTSRRSLAIRRPHRVMATSAKSRLILAARLPRTQATWNARFAVPAGWAGAALMTAGSIAVSSTIFLEYLLVGSNPDAGFNPGQLRVFFGILHGAALAPTLAFASLSVHYLTRPGRRQAVPSLMAATASLISLLIVLTPPEDGTRWWLLAAFGTLLVATGAWLAFAGRGIAHFARSLRAPAFWLIAAGLMFLAMWSWILGAANTASTIYVFPVLWALGLMAVGVGYVISMRRLRREKSEWPPAHLAGTRRSPRRGAQRG